jgi:glyoxylase-like metal-dependent hydrolase (beta-lactamase superfamily II)
MGELLKILIIGPFTHSSPLTEAGDVQVVFTPGHTVGHYSVVVQEDDHALFFAADTSYTQQLMLDQTVDGVTLNVAQYQETARQVLTYLQSVPTVYLPTHDPESAQRLAARAVAIPSEHLIRGS